jgi:hypothetical protein
VKKEILDELKQIDRKAINITSHKINKTHRNLSQNHDKREQLEENNNTTVII